MRWPIQLAEAAREAEVRLRTRGLQAGVARELRHSAGAALAAVFPLPVALRASEGSACHLKMSLCGGSKILQEGAGAGAQIAEWQTASLLQVMRSPRSR